MLGRTKARFPLFGKHASFIAAAILPLQIRPLKAIWKSTLIFTKQKQLPTTGQKIKHGA